MAETAGWGMSGWGGTLSSGGGGGGGGDGPTVENFYPPAGTDIKRGQDITFDVLFENPLSSLTVYVEYYETGATEVCFQKEGFTLAFRNGGGFLGSELQLLPAGAGYHFILRRRTGWPHSPSVRVEGSDDAGQAIEE